MNERALSFGSVVAAYERFRPGYPDELVDLVLAYAGRGTRTALEIGAGTGKATRAFARRGIDVLATEPDPEMLAELERQAPGSRTRRCSFEELEVGETFDLVYAAAAMHWTRPEGRWAKVANLLRERGVFASFGGPVELADPDDEAAVQAVLQRHGIDERVPSPDGTPEADLMQWPGSELQASELFEDVQQHRVERPLRMSSEDYVGSLSTVSAYLTRPPDVRSAALTEIRAALPETVEVDADLVVHLARRR